MKKHVIWALVPATIVVLISTIFQTPYNQSTGAQATYTQPALEEYITLLKNSEPETVCPQIPYFAGQTIEVFEQHSGFKNTLTVYVWPEVYVPEENLGVIFGDSTGISYYKDEAGYKVFIVNTEKTKINIDTVLNYTNSIRGYEIVFSITNSNGVYTSTATCKTISNEEKP